jgi:O-antigen/teichoic acid export membrane protein
MGQSAQEAPSLGRLVGRGLSWSLLGQVATRAGSFLAGIALARLLAPEDFGALAVALVAVNLLGACNELGVVPAVVRWKGDVRAAARTGMTLALLGSVAAYAVAFVGAPHLAALMSSDAATSMLRVLALTLVIDGVVAIPQALLYRSFRQAEMAAAEALGMVVFIVVAIGLAAVGIGAMSMAWGRLAGSAATGLLYVRRQPFPGSPRFDVGHARALLVFGVPLGLSHLVWEGVLNVDYLVVGQILGPATLGIYLLAFNLSNWPVSIISVAVQRVSFAAFSHLVQDRDRLPAAFCRSFGVAVTATVPLVVVVVVLAPEVVRVLYGEQWSAAATAVQFLLVLGGLRVLLDLMFDLLAADGRSMANMAVRSLWLVSLVPALWVGARLDGIRGAGVAHVLVAVLVVLPTMLVALARSGITARLLAGAAARPVVAGASTAVTMVLGLQFIDGDLARLVVVGGLGVAVYAVGIGVRNPLVRWTWQQVRPTAQSLGRAA